ncbi:MAG: DMT family transporter [Trueperaceae bacterium]|nr:DMT family transporter [Truepera sp.]HRQ09627.1 DMT family transporter [Trueperaceae bacterium]
MATEAPGSSAPPRKVWAVLGVALLAVSFASIFIRWADAPGVVVAFYRMALAGILMAPLTRAGLRRTPPNARAWRASLLAGLMLAVHFAAWITSLSYTTVAASVSLLASTPLWVVLFAWTFQRRPPSAAQLTGVLVAVGGAAVVGYGDLAGGPQPLVGDLLALVGAAAAGAYLLFGRQAQASGMGLQAYAGTAYAVAALVLAPMPLLVGAPYLGYPLSTYLFIALLALIPQLVGHTGINYAAKHLDPTLVASTLLTEPVASGLLALIIFSERPSLATIVGAAILLAGIAIAVRAAPQR